MLINNGELNTLIQEKLDADTDFQDSLVDLSDEDKQTAIDAKQQELLEAETLALKEKADKALKAEELAKNYKVRAEKAEALAKKSKGDDTPKKSDYSLQDIRALADVHDEDVDDVTEYAKFKNISVAEAKKTPMIQTLLKDKEENRKSAQAANTGGGRRGATTPTHDQVLKDFADGKVSEDDKDIAKLVEARFEARKAEAKRA